jgi:transposase
VAGLEFGTVESVADGGTLASWKSACLNAIVATEHSLIIAIWYMFNNGEYYYDFGGDYYHRLIPARFIQRKIVELEAAGCTVTCEVAA